MNIRQTKLSLAAVLAAIGLSVAAVAPVSAEDGVITQYPAGNPDDPSITQSGDIAAGLDGNLWFTVNGNSSLISAITTAGAVTQFAATANSNPAAITAGVDTNLWFTQGGSKIGTMTTAGAITDFAGISLGYRAIDIAAGPDGNMWFTAAPIFSFAPDGKIGKITPAGEITEYSGAGLTSPTIFIAVGPDGNIWFTQPFINSVGKITTTGMVTTVWTGPNTAFPLGIAAGPDGNMWIADASGSIRTINPGTGVQTEFALPAIGNGFPNQITGGPDGNMWFTDSNDGIWRITMSGDMTRFESTGTGVSNPVTNGITAGPDGNMWFTQTNANYIGTATSGAEPPVVSAVSATNATVEGTLYPGGMTETIKVQCATDPAFTAGLVNNLSPTGSPTSATAAATVTGSCTGLTPGTLYHTRLAGTSTVANSAPIDTHYTTTNTFTTLKNQTPRKKCVRIPKSIPLNGQVKLLNRNCRTNAGKRIQVRVVGPATNARGDVTPYKLRHTKAGTFLRTFGLQLKLEIIWSAAPVTGYDAYRKSRSYRSSTARS